MGATKHACNRKNKNVKYPIALNEYSGSSDTNAPQGIAEDIESAVNTNKAGSTTSSGMESYHTTASVCID